jgi:hypothetical protein
MVKRLGPERASKLITASPELPHLLREAGGELFALAAAASATLMAIARASLVDSEDEEIADANSARIQLHDYLLKALASIDE